MKNKEQKLKAFERLLEIMDTLRQECPWDKKQTFESLRNLTIEETFELADAIDKGNLEEVKKELGDLMLHMVFYSKLGEEKNAFDASDVLNSVCEKLIFRHPHIYGDVKAETEEQVKQNWEKLKLKEGNKSIFSGVPISLPAMIKAYRIQQKAKGVGFEFENKSQVLDKVQEEITEFKDATTKQEKEAEFGDILFSLINFARFEGIDPETALELTNKKFITRFQKMESLIESENKNLTELSTQELEVFYQRAKKNLNQ